VADVKIYVNEVCEYFDKRSTPSVDLSTIGIGFLQDDDLAGSNSASFRHITSLNLSLNVIKSLSFGLLLRYPNLLDLDVSRNCLISLDAKHRILFQGLTTLNASHNLITSVHPFVFSNISLEVVDLSHNHLLRFLAADFEIKQLHITDNRLTQVEIDSGHHKELKLLDASNNNLKIFQLNVDFNNLILSSNQLTMDEQFSIRNVYGTLDMSRNHISEFSWKFTSCVTNLDISYNHMAAFRVDCPAKRFQRLKRLNLDGNFLCNLNEAFNMTRCFPNLKFITAMFNRLSKAQRIEIKSALRKMKVKSQMFDYDAQPIAPCDDDDCIAFNIFFKQN
jgi:Leucine-rich repeat (LRR) protein